MSVPPDLLEVTKPLFPSTETELCSRLTSHGIVIIHQESGHWAAVAVDADKFKGANFKTLRRVCALAPDVPVYVVYERKHLQRDFLTKYCTRIGMNNVTVISDYGEVCEIFRKLNNGHRDV